MKYKIGVFGSADGDLESIISKAHKLGEELGKRKVIVISGATTGLPQEASFVAHKHGAKLWGFSAGTDLASHNQLAPGLDSSIYSKLIYIPKDYEFASSIDVCRKYRNVTSTASCDAGIIISGRWGTMNEFTNLYDIGKIIGVLTGTGGIADELESMMKRITKPSKAKVLFDSNPKILVGKIFDKLGN